MARSPSSSSASSSSPSPVKRRRSTVGGKHKGKKGSKGKRATGTERKRTHWLVLVKAIYASSGTKGSTGLTAAMKEGPKYLAEFKGAFPEVPSDVVATEWFRGKL